MLRGVLSVVLLGKLVVNFCGFGELLRSICIDNELLESLCDVFVVKNGSFKLCDEEVVEYIAT